MTAAETKANLSGARNHLDAALRLLRAVKSDPVAMCNLQGHGSLDVVLLEVEEQRDYLKSAFNV